MISQLLKGFSIGPIKIKDKSAYAFLVRSMLNHKYLVLCSLLLTLATSFFIVFPNEYLKKSINAMSTLDKSRIWRYSIFYFLLIVFADLIDVAKNYVNDSMNRHITQSVQRASFSHLIRLPYDFHDRFSSSDILKRELNNIDSIGSSVVQISNLIVLIVSSLCAFYLALRIDPLLTILTFVLLEPVRFHLTKYSTKKTKEMSNKEQVISTNLLKMIQETLRGIREIKFFNAETQIIKKFGSMVNDYVKLSLNMSAFKNLIFLCMLYIHNIAIFAVIVRSGYRVVQGEIGPGDIFAIIAYFTMLQGRINIFLSSLTSFQSALVKIERSIEILAEEIEAEPEQICRMDIKNIEGTIELSNVSFQYPSNLSNFSLLNINLSASKENPIGIVGLSGSGKSTIIKLLTGLYSNYEGLIQIDGQDIRNFSPRQLRDCIGILSQDPFIFDASVKENISLGCEEATDAEIIKAAKIANAHSFIKELADGYDTIVGENGAKLSGGQKQRLALARVLLRNPKILILDEPTSSIDSESQKAIIDALSEVTKDRTTIIITHQFPILQLVKYIYVFEKGQIVEQGTHESLLHNSKWYYRLWNNQFNANIDKSNTELSSVHSKLLAAE